MEKRRYSRVGLELTAYLRCRDISVKVEVDNLSLKGVKLKTDQTLQRDDLVDLTLYLTGTSNPLDISVHVTGRVVRTEERGLVIQFQEIDLDSFGRLKNIIAYNDGDEDKVMEEFLKAIDGQ